MTKPADDFKSRLTLDEKAGLWMDQTRRYMFIRPDALMGMFRRLPERERLMAFEAIAQSITQQGGDSARAYQAMGGTGDGLLHVIAQTAPQLGWGHWQFSRDDQAIHLTVTDSPFAAGYGSSDQPVCYPIIGMLTAVGEMVLGGAVTATETACAAMGAPACRFEIVRQQG